MTATDSAGSSAPAPVAAASRLAVPTAQVTQAILLLAPELMSLDVYAEDHRHDWWLADPKSAATVEQRCAGIAAHTKRLLRLHEVMWEVMEHLTGDERKAKKAVDIWLGARMEEEREMRELLGDYSLTPPDELPSPEVVMPS